MTSPLLVRQVSPVRRDLVLNSPSNRNALTDALTRHLRDEVQNAARDDQRMIVIRSESAAFSGGLDLRGIDDETDESIAVRLIRIALLLEEVQHSSLFVVAVIDGPAVGAGADLALACDLRMTTGRASFRFPGAGFGAVLGTARLAHLVGAAHALEILAENALVDAHNAERFGLTAGISTESEIEDRLDRLGAGLDRLPDGTTVGLKGATDDTDRHRPLADLVRSVASERGLKDRVIAFAASARSRRRNGN